MESNKDVCLEQYPEEIRKSVGLIREIERNFREMAGWKNVGIASEVLELLDSLPSRGQSHNPYDKIFLLDRLVEKISSRDVPRLTVSVLRRMLELFDEVREGDADGYDDILERESVADDLEKWESYIDIGNVSDKEWTDRYWVYLKFDPVERTPRWEEMYPMVEKEVEEEIDEDVPRGMGFCHMYWSVKSRVLRRYGIEWRSPAEMNPGVLFD